MRVFFLAALTFLLTADAWAQRPRPTGTLRPATLPVPQEDEPEMVWRYSPTYGEPTAVSGRPSSRVHEGEGFGGLNGGPIYAIEMGEKNDRPCYLRVFYTRQNAEYRESEDWEVCAGSGPTTSSRRRIGAATPAQGTSRVPALIGLQVCSNDRSGTNYRVKGLRVRMGRSNEVGQGSVRAVPSGNDEFERTNCRDWEQLRMCPSGQVIVGLDVHYNLRNGQGAITGLAPRCAASSLEEVSNPECGPGHC
ncbi:MAG: hypothetical protein AAGI52_12515 [Bacteroidota bacterium]